MEISSVKKFYNIYPLKKLIIKGKEWEYISCGNGKLAFLLLPGGGQTAQSNFQMIESFKVQYKIIAPTIYDSDSIDELCNAMDVILKKENTGKIILYGLSIGGMMAQSYIRRNKNKVLKLIISHAPAPRSKTYKIKIIPSLMLLKFILPFIPISFIKFLSQKFSLKFQGGLSRNYEKFKITTDNRTQKLLNYFVSEFYQKYMTKRLLKTWINLHFDYCFNEKFTPADLLSWRGKLLILRTDNDPLAYDDGEYQRLYPDASVYTFHGTGHLTFYYQYEKMVKVIKKFLYSTSSQNGLGD